jgi:hypothetical protein
MNQLASDRLQVAFVEFEASQRQTEADKQRQRETIEARQHKFESATIDQILPALQKVAQTIQELGYSAAARFDPSPWESGPVLEFFPKPPPLPTHITPYYFAVKLRWGDVVYIIHSNVKSVYSESREIVAPAIEDITAEWVEQAAVTFVEAVLAQSRDRQ